MFTVYRITNLLNNRFYIGVHKTNIRQDNAVDTYMGSGIAIKRAIRKYGPENFSKEILFEFPTEEDAFLKETELLKTHREDPLCYNLHEGGKGGFGYIREKSLQFKIPRKFLTGRPTGAKNIQVPIMTTEKCAYGCGAPARFLIGAKQTRCCSEHHRKCPAFKLKKFEPLPVPSTKRCPYGCKQAAGWIITSSGKLCCSRTFYDCKGHWNKVATTNIWKYGHRSSLRNEEVRAKASATMVERYGVDNAQHNPELKARHLKSLRKQTTDI